MMGYGYYGERLNDQERATEKTAWWFKETSSGKRIWPGQNYVLLLRFYDENGRPPIRGLHWARILTPKEYTVYLLTRDSKKR